MSDSWAYREYCVEYDRTPSTGVTNTASQACLACRKQKRKCDKALPICGLCQRLGRPCDYNTEGQAAQPSSLEFEALRQKVADLEGLLSQVVGSNGSTSTSGGTLSISSSDSVSPFGDQTDQSGCDSTQVIDRPRSKAELDMGFFFLDSYAHGYAGYSIQPPLIKVPEGALAALGSSFDLREMIETYFATVHTFLPIVSKIRLYQFLSSEHHDPGADLALLFMTMKLINSSIPVDTSAQTPLYQDVKQLYSYTESRNGFSIHVIQSLILIALYEIGHSIYPAAYLTTGHAARLAHAMGLHQRDAPQLLRKPSTWTEQEERRRVWWAIVILDRFVNIGARAKPFASAEPSLDTCLPTDDEAWDRGKMVMTAPLSLSATQIIKNVSPFARTCQAAHLLGKIIAHLNDTTMPQEFRFEESLQLNRATRTLLAAITQEAGEVDPNSGVERQFCTSMALCLSALLIFYDMYSCSDTLPPDASETRLMIQKEAIEGITDASAKVLELAKRVREGLKEKSLLQKFSPLVVDCFYQAAANYAWYYRESSEPEYGRHLVEMKETLALIDQRWKAGGQYIYNLARFWERGAEEGGGHGYD